MDQDEGNIAWEDDDEDIEWEKDDDDDAFTTEITRASLAKCNGAGVKDLAEDREQQQQQQQEEEDEPGERRWLGENGEIVVELPREGEDGDIDGLEGNEVSAADEAEGYIGGDGLEGKIRQKGKTKARRFTAEEIRRALNVHKVHLVCLVARCSLVSRWANDPAVQAAMVSCLPTQIIHEIKMSATGREDPLGGAGSAPREPDGPRLTALVVWFHRFISILDDDTVGGGSGGDRQWGSHPARLLRVIEQRVGCAQEAVQLFVALCRGLGLRARYVACLDPLPPHPVSGRASKRRTGRNSTADPVTIDLTAEERHRTRRRRRGGGGGGPGGSMGLGARSRAWAEVLCRGREGGDLYVVTSDMNKSAPRQLPVKRFSAVESKSQSLAKRARPSRSCNNNDHAAEPKVGAASPGSVDGSGEKGIVDSRRQRSKKGRGRGLEGSVQAPMEEDDDVDTKFGVAGRSKRKALASASDQGERAETEPEVKSCALLDHHDRVLAAPTAAERGGSSGSGSDPVDEGSLRATSGTFRERWAHVDPVEGAVDQASKVQDLRFRKRLMPYVVAEDERRRIVDVTRRYSTEWSRTLRTRGRAMASPDGWWNRALRLWGASSDGVGKAETGNGRVDNPLVVDGCGAEDTRDDHASEEKELQEKVDSEPVPSTIAALKNHHVYVLGKNLLKHEGLRPGAKAAGLVRGCKVFLKIDVARLKGASRWKLDGLKVKDSEVEKPAKVATKKGEKDGEGTSKLYGDWQTESWAPDPAVNGKVPKNEYGNVEFFECSPALLPAGTEHVRGDQISRVASKLGVDYAPALTGFETKQGRQVPVLDGIIVCKEHCQMLQDAHTAWEQAILEKRAKAREKRLLKRWRTLFVGVMEGKRILEEYGSHN